MARRSDRRPLGELEGAGVGRVDSDVCGDHHDIRNRMPGDPGAWRLCALAERRARSARLDAAVPGVPDADVADLDPASTTTPLDRRADRQLGLLLPQSLPQLTPGG